MSTTSRNLVTRGLRQMDRAFWCLHDHLPTFAILGLPTLIVSTLFASAVAFILRTWNIDELIAFFLWSWLVPVCSLTILTFLPLPCAVFAWFQARNEVKTVRECYAFCLHRTGRILPVFVWLVLSYAWWFLFFGIPMLVFWPRTCQVPMVALFEDSPRIFRRSRQLMREDHAIHVLAALFLGMSMVLGVLIPLPRLILFSELLEGEWTRLAEESLWAFELTAGILLLCIVAISWSVSLALFYHDLRRYREGEEIRSKVDRLFQKYDRIEATQ